MVRIIKQGNPIWVYYQDIDSGENVQMPKLLQGKEGDQFNVLPPKFDKYKFVKSAGDLSGTFDMQQRSIHFYYRKKAWGEIERVELYIHLSKPVQQYDGVDGMPVDTHLPGDFYVKSFERVATMQGEFWYNVNADRWIKFDVNTMKVSKEDPYAKSQPVDNGPASQLTVLPLNDVPATVDYTSGGHLFTYKRPYGEANGTVENGYQLTLVGRLNDNNGVTWYQDKKLGFINGAYVRLQQEDD